MVAGITLPNDDSTITYEIEVTNIGNIESMIDSITGLDSHLEIKNITGYTLKTDVCDDNDSTMCKLGAVKHFNVTIGYKTGEYDSSSIDFSIMMNFNFEYTSDKVAKAGDYYYDTLSLAINSVDANNPDTTLVILLKNTTENIQIDAGEKVYLDLKDKTLTCSGNNNAIKNYGTLTIKNGNVNCAASTNGAINNYNTGNITIDGTRVTMTGGRQAFWNDRGISKITGNAYLYSSSNLRAAVHNISPGSMTIESGTIISTRFAAIRNEKKDPGDGVLIIGIKDGNVHTDSPFIQSSSSSDSKHYAVNTDFDFKFYDGTLKSIANNVNLTSRIKTDDESGIINYDENIDGTIYHFTRLGDSVKITINGVVTTLSEPYSAHCTFREINQASGVPITSLPECGKSGYNFVEFNTSADGTGTAYEIGDIVDSNLTLYAIWEKTSEVARIGTNPTLYDTLQDAINAAPTDGTTVDIYLLKDIQEILTIGSDKNIIFHLSGRTITNTLFEPVIVNNGNITISDGSIYSSADQSIINHQAGILNISGGIFEITGNRQVLYITGGTVNISGTPYMSSMADGITTGGTLERGTVHNVSGILNITGGTFVGVKQSALSNQSTLTIGVDDGTIGITTPVFIGATYGIFSVQSFDFYDGIAKGISGAVNGVIIDHNDGTQMADGAETIDNKTYYTKYRELIP